MGTDDRHKKRKARNTQKKRVEQKAVLIALEDTKSSKYYFQALLKDKKFTGYVEFAKNIGSNPKKVLEALEKHKEENIKTIFEKEWIVIDRDSFPNNDFFGTIETARKKNICVAFSNESYELWILLHFESVNGNTSRKDLNSRLKKIFLDRFQIEYAKSSQDVYLLIRSLQEIAIKNAKILVKQHIKNYGKIDPSKNPITMIYQLVECLNSLYNKDNNCDCFPNKGGI
jgi:hypothetical protein